MADELRTITAEETKTAEELAAVMNGIVKKSNALFAGTATKAEFNQLKADTIVQSREILATIEKGGEEMAGLKEEVKKFMDVVKIQGESITVLKTAFDPKVQRKSFAEQVYDGLMLKENGFDAFIEGRTSKARMQLATKDLAFTGTYGSGAAQQAFMPFTTPNAPDVENFDVRLIVSTGTIDSEKLEYPQERAASRTNNADWTTENGETTASAIGFTMATVNSERYTDHIKVSRRAMRNTSWLAAYIQAALLQAFITKLNTGVIAGDGTGNTLNGLLNNANTFAGTGLAGMFPNPDYFSVLRAARAEMKKTYKRTPNHVMLDPIDYAIMSDARTTIGDFISTKFMSANGIGYDNIIGMRSVESADITDGGYLLADLVASTVQLLFNGPIEILASDSDDDNFTKNLITLKIEADVMLPIYNTNALLKGTLATDKETIRLV